MKLAVAHLKSLSPFSQSRFHNVPKLPKEADDDYEKRTWREHCHTVSVEDDRIVIPPMMFKNSLAAAAAFLSMKIAGKGQQTWTKHFEAGVLCVDHMVLPIRKSEVKGEWLFLNADGKKGGGKRVLRCYPLIPQWEGDVIYHIMDDLITEKVFRDHLVQCGQLIGIGRFRPRNGGYYGRFTVEDLKWQDTV